MRPRRDRLPPADGSGLFPHSNPAVVISRHLNSPAPALSDTRPELSTLDAVAAARSFVATVTDAGTVFGLIGNNPEPAVKTAGVVAQEWRQSVRGCRDRRYPSYVRLGWPLTCRSKEMRLIDAALSDRDCCGIVVCGAAGVGKSRIAREATAWAASTGCEVRWVVATSSARAVPLGALSSWAGPAGGDSLNLVRGVIE